MTNLPTIDKLRQQRQSLVAGEFVLIAKDVRQITAMLYADAASTLLRRMRQLSTLGCSRASERLDLKTCVLL